MDNVALFKDSLLALREGISGCENQKQMIMYINFISMASSEMITICMQEQDFGGLPFVGLYIELINHIAMGAGLDSVSDSKLYIYDKINMIHNLLSPIYNEKA